MFESFVKQLYLSFLGRPADPEGLEFWQRSLESQAQSPAGLALAFAEGAEFIGLHHPVIRLYSATLDRVPDYAGLRYWVDAYQGGAPLQSVAGAFAGTEEFASRFGQRSDAEFISALYQNTLGRAPDGSGARYWESILSGGG